MPGRAKVSKEKRWARPSMYLRVRREWLQFHLLQHTHSYSFIHRPSRHITYSTEKWEGEVLEYLSCKWCQCLLTRSPQLKECIKECIYAHILHSEQQAAMFNSSAWTDTLRKLLVWTNSPPLCLPRQTLTQTFRLSLHTFLCLLWVLKRKTWRQGWCL